MDYAGAQERLAQLLEASVKRRLIADVPLGAFLSGGIDSSVIVALAARHTDHLNTFSIGYKDEPFFDETRYANLVARKFKTNHTVFSLSNDDLYEHLFDMLDYTDEPFADSSALAVFILSKRTRKKVTVALSGDGADELFAGYNKHRGEYRVREGGLTTELAKGLAPLWNALPKSRNSPLGNKVRQLQKLAEGARLGRKRPVLAVCHAYQRGRCPATAERIEPEPGRRGGTGRTEGPDLSSTSGAGATSTNSSTPTCNWCCPTTC
jgi:asparagine synthase (glutamine-hydrolysing)